MRSYCTPGFFCREEDVEDRKAKLKEKGYCWDLYRYPNETNEYRRYEFRVWAVVDLEKGTVKPQ